MNTESNAGRDEVAKYLLVWVCLFLILFVVILTFGGVSPARAIAPALSMVLPNALLGRFSLRLARWWPLRESRSRAWLVRHGLALLGYTLACLAIWQLIRLAEARAMNRDMLPADSVLIFWLFVNNSLAHTVMAAIGYVRKASLDINAESARVVESERLRSKAELALLRTQLNPHFLLNTLHAVLGLVRRDPAVAERAIETLGDLVRTGQGLQATGDSISLGQEWNFVGRYLELEELRFGERLRATLLASPEALEARVPPFSLLPLVENAVIHGVAARASGGELRVTAERAGNRLVVSVTDSGPGASEAAILSSPRLGLRLLRERLAHLYGGGASLSFGPGTEGGFRAQMILPFETGHAD